MKTSQRAYLTTGGLILAAISFVAINIFSNSELQSARLDLTEGKLYTLSSGSKSIVTGLEEPITLRFFFSDKMSSEVPAIRSYALRVRELLDEYVNRSNGMIRLEVIDPEPFSDAEDQAVGYGLQGVPLNNEGQTFYFGLVGSDSTNTNQNIPFFAPDREAFLEYDLTKLIHGLSDPKKPVVGVLTPLPMEGAGGSPMMMQQGGQPAWQIIEQMRQFTDVEMLDLDISTVPEKVDILLVAHPADLAPRTQYAIDQFVMNKGRAIFLVDPQSEAAAASSNPMQGKMIARISDLPNLFSAYGIGFDAKNVLADRGKAQRVAGSQNRQRVVDYVLWQRFDRENFDATDIATAELKSLNFATAGVVSKTEKSELTMTPLITSSTDAAVVPVEKASGQPDPELLLREFQSANKSFVIGARFTGKVKTAFPDGPPPPEPAKEGEPPAEDKPLPAQVKESANPINVIVIGDVDFIQDRFWINVQNFFGANIGTPIADNGSFLINAVDNLFGSSDLISLRSRGESLRPFTAIAALRRQAEQQFLVEEQLLRQKLEDTQKQLEQLQGGKEGKGPKGDALLTPEQEQALTDFRAQLVETRRQLRDVQHNLNRDIEALSTAVKFFNIGLMPLVICLVALGAWKFRQRRRAS